MAVLGIWGVKGDGSQCLSCLKRNNLIIRNSVPWLGFQNWRREQFRLPLNLLHITIWNLQLELSLVRLRGRGVSSGYGSFRNGFSDANEVKKKVSLFGQHYFCTLSPEPLWFCSVKTESSVGGRWRRWVGVYGWEEGLAPSLSFDLCVISGTGLCSLQNILSSPIHSTPTEDLLCWAPASCPHKAHHSDGVGRGGCAANALTAWQSVRNKTDY